MYHKLIITLLLFCSISFGQSDPLLTLFSDGYKNPETTLYLAGQSVSGTQATRIDDFISMVKDSFSITSLSQKFDAIWLLANESSTLALRNIVKRLHDATAQGSPTFTQWQGYTSASSKYLNLNYTPSTQAVNYTQNSGSFGLYSRTDKVEDNLDIGARTNSTTKVSFLAIRTNSGGTNTIIYPINQGGNNISSSSAVTDSRGFFVVSRTASNAVEVYRNASTITTTTTASTALTEYSFYLGSLNQANTATTFATKQYAFAFVASGLTDEEVRKLYNCVIFYLDGVGAYIANNIFNINKLNNGIQTASNIHTPFTSFKFSTNADYIRVSAIATLYSAYPAWSYLKIYVDGEHYDYEKITTLDPYTIYLPGGTKTVEITEDGTTKPTTTVLGTFISSVGVQATKSYTIIQDVADERLVFIGNSITIGGNATYLQQGFPMLFRDSSNYVNVYGWGRGNIGDMAQDSATAQTTVNWIDSLADGTDSNKVIICLGTNDYGLETMSADDFEDDYAFFLYLLNKERPDIKIFAVTPLIRSSEVANSFSDTLDDYRTAITNAASGKAYVTVLNGKTILTTGDLADGVHPTTAGHLKVYNALKLLIL